MSGRRYYLISFINLTLRAFRRRTSTVPLPLDNHPLSYVLLKTCDSSSTRVAMPGSTMTQNTVEPTQGLAGAPLDGVIPICRRPGLADPMGIWRSVRNGHRQACSVWIRKLFLSAVWRASYTVLFWSSRLPYTPTPEPPCRECFNH